jgi:hypothetical protein
VNWDRMESRSYDHTVRANVAVVVGSLTVSQLPSAHPFSTLIHRGTQAQLFVGADKAESSRLECG